LQYNAFTEGALLEVDDGAGLQDLTVEEAQKLKTKIRRLYDIANVLQSIGLIEKTNHTHNKKPAFRWVGIHGVHAFMYELKEERL
jgi:transcription factor E2F7/8